MCVCKRVCVCVYVCIVALIFVYVHACVHCLLRGVCILRYLSLSFSFYTYIYVYTYIYMRHNRCAAPAKLTTWLCLLHRSALKRDILISRSGASFSATEVKINRVSFSRWLSQWAFPWQWFRQIIHSVSGNLVNPSMRAPPQLARHLATLRSLRLTCVYIYIPTINTSGQLHNRFHIKSCICITYIYRDLYACM